VSGVGPGGAGAFGDSPAQALGRGRVDGGGDADDPTSVLSLSLATPLDYEFCSGYRQSGKKSEIIYWVPNEKNSLLNGVKNAITIYYLSIL